MRSLDSPYHLMPGARAWRLMLRRLDLPDERLCGREGWHGGTMASALQLSWPPQQHSRLQLGQSTRGYGSSLRAREK